jgi:signal transduction histidine kinase
MKHSLCAFFFLITAVLPFEGFTQNKDASSELLLRKAYQSSDSSDIYFKQVQKRISTEADKASYLYFKAFKAKALQQADSAMYYSEKVIPLLLKLDSLERLRKIYNTAHYIRLEQGNYEGALYFSQKALSVAEKQKDTANISLHLSDIGNVYHDFEDYEKGVLYAKKAYAIMNSASEKQYKYLIFANNIIGINFDDWQKPDSALHYHYKNLKLLKKVEDTLRFSFVYNNIGNTLLKQKKYAEARKYQTRALVIDKIRNHAYSLASDYNNLATIAYNENQIKLAENYFVEAEKYAKESGFIEKIRDVTQQQAWFYKKTGNYKMALELQEQFFILRDSVFKEKRAVAVAEMETKYQTEKKERDLQEMRANLAEKELEVKQKNNLIYGSLGLALLLGLIGYLFYGQQKLKNRQLQKESELKNALAKIETQNQLQEQRLRISRDLHDNIGSQLTFIISSIDNLKFGLEGTSNTVTNKLEKISDFTSQTIYELRDTIWAMNKTDILVEDLQARISNFIDKANLASNVDFQFILDHAHLKETSFTSVEGMNMYRIIQEAVNNALKYSEASLIKVQLAKAKTAEKNRFHLFIIDNGKGFDMEKAIFGNGIANIKKRANELGGTVKITSEKEKGTIVDLRF